MSRTAPLPVYDPSLNYNGLNPDLGRIYVPNPDTPRASGRVWVPIEGDPPEWSRTREDWAARDAHLSHRDSPHPAPSAWRSPCLVTHSPPSSGASSTPYTVAAT
jgi:hypothetical protein